jgi:hypothetical protein
MKSSYFHAESSISVSAFEGSVLSVSGNFSITADVHPIHPDTFDREAWMSFTAVLDPSKSSGR